MGDFLAVCGGEGWIDRCMDGLTEGCIDCSQKRISVLNFVVGWGGWFNQKYRIGIKNMQNKIQNNGM